jgi:hypothetical protein
MEITLESVAILLSIIAFSVTIIGFFASLKFYRDGIELQRSANDVLSKISNKTDSIQDQVSGMFDKTLNAALSKQEQVSVEFESIQEKIQKSAEEIGKKVKHDIEGLGHEKVEEISKAIKSEMTEISKQLQTARQSLESQEPQVEIPQVIRSSAVARQILLELSVKYQLKLSELLSMRPDDSAMITNRINRLLKAGLILEIKTEEEPCYSISKSGIAVTKIMPRK